LEATLPQITLAAQYWGARRALDNRRAAVVSSAGRGAVRVVAGVVDERRHAFFGFGVWIVGACRGTPFVGFVGFR
jgi:hypothetical protein